MSQLSLIENQILSIKRGVVQYGSIEYKDTLLFNDDSGLLAELETKRQFLLDRRESWLPKTIWNLIVPIVISVFTTILTLFVTNL